MAKNRGKRDDDAERDSSEDIAEEFDEDVDADAEEYEDDLEDEDLADAELDPEKETVPPRRGSARAKASAGASSRSVARSKSKEEKRPGLVRRLGIFIREVVAELQKVIWPTRRELLTYTTVVVLFVAIMMTFVALLDLGFAKGLFWVFGGNPTETPTTP